MINIKLKDGSVKEVEDNSSLMDLAASISRKLGKSAVVGEVNGKLVDLSYVLKENDEVNILTYENKEAVEVMRHSLSHIMAQAVQRIYKGAKLAIGPFIDNGFYYDFDIDESITVEDLPKIEKEMNNIIKENLKLKYSKNILH